MRETPNETAEREMTTGTTIACLVLIALQIVIVAAGLYYDRKGERRRTNNRFQ